MPLLVIIGGVEVSGRNLGYRLRQPPHGGAGVTDRWASRRKEIETLAA